MQIRDLNPIEYLALALVGQHTKDDPPYTVVQLTQDMMPHPATTASDNIGNLGASLRKTDDGSIRRDGGLVRMAQSMSGAELQGTLRITEEGKRALINYRHAVLLTLDEEIDAHNGRASQLREGKVKRPASANEEERRAGNCLKMKERIRDLQRSVFATLPMSADMRACLAEPEPKPTATPKGAVPDNTEGTLNLATPGSTTVVDPPAATKKGGPKRRRA